MTRSLPDQLCELTGRRYALVTGRGATALYLALRAAGLQGQRVVLPANICPAAVCPVVYSGNHPVFCDMNLADFGVDLGSLRSVLAGGVAAAIIPHSYGHAAPMGEISRLCRESGVLLIEDAAPALGAAPEGAPAGSHGDCSVLSFGYAKIVDAGMGGALVTDDHELLVEAQRLEAELPTWTAGMDRRQADMAHVVRGWWNGRRTEPRLDAVLRRIWSLYREAHLWRLPAGQEARIAAALRPLRDLVAHRQANFAAYQQLLAAAPVHRPAPRPGSVPWRYTCLVHEAERDRIVEGLRGQGVDVSTLYPAAHRQFDAPAPCEAPNCDYLDRSVINLWVAPPLTLAEVRENAARLVRLLADCAPPSPPRAVRG